MRFSMITVGGLLLAAATPAMAEEAPAGLPSAPEATADAPAAPAAEAEAAPVAPLLQDEAEAPADAFTIAGGVTATSDYRFRGISQSGKDPAFQATVTVNHESGFYAGVWASTLDDNESAAILGYGDVETDLFVGYTKTFDNGVGIDVGLLYYLYAVDESVTPTDFFEPYATVSYTAGPFTGKVGVNYAWSQAGTFHNDNIYFRGDASYAIGGTPLTVVAHVGYTDGPLGFLKTPALVPNDYIDWSLGIEASHKFVKLGVQYVDTNIKGFGVNWDKAVGANPTALAYLTLSF